MALTQAPSAPIVTGDAHRSFEDLFGEHIRAGYQIIYVPTTEEARVEKAIKAVARAQQLEVATWDQFDGFQSASPNCRLAIPENVAPTLKDPNAALKLFGEATNPVAAEEKDKKKVALPNKTVYIMRDMDDFFAAPPIRRAFRSLFEGNRLVNDKNTRPIVIISPKLEIHPKLRSAISILEFNLPTEEQLNASLEFVLKSLGAKDPSKAAISAELRADILAACRGLTSTEAENALSRAVIRFKGFSTDVLPMLRDEKAAIVKKGEVLTYRDESSITKREDIGGMENLWSFIDLRKKAYTKKAREEHIDNPKGMVLVGVPGTGKSVVAECTAAVLGLPLYTMDVGAIFGSLVGESEGRMRDAIRQISAQDGCVLLIDEADKAWGNAHDSRGDSGVTQRVFGQLLSWLAGKKDRTFVIMTLNRTNGLPPEFLRKGRFDAIYYTDLPNETERRQILEIHLRKRHVDVASLGLSPEQWDTLIAETTEFVGAELEQVIVDARYNAFAARETGKPSFDELFAAVKGIVPLAKLDEQGIKDIRDFCKNRATPVTPPVVASAGRRARSRGLDLGNSSVSN